MGCSETSGISHAGVSTNARARHRLIVFVPAYNPGALLEPTVRSLLAYHPDVWVLVDGSTDRSEDRLDGLTDEHRGFRVLRRSQNNGKGATVLEGALEACAQGFTHVLCADADGQHPAGRVPDFKRVSQLRPDSLIMGEPRFGGDAPIERVYFRRLGNFLARLETGGRLRWDSLFGMRVYPIPALLRAFSKTRHARRYDFETEVAVRMVWDGVDVVGLCAEVRYLNRNDGGVSHFRYVRDNLVLAGMHGRLLFEATMQMVRGVWI
jgi:glycosyltransferase involved in cell wall biosynthesis